MSKRSLNKTLLIGCLGAVADTRRRLCFLGEEPTVGTTHS